ncbi:MAG TPA: HNH endonuclease [Nitrospira sp.]|nr:HNH endonuclease [Nitrospira sp.]
MPTHHPMNCGSKLKRDPKNCVYCTENPGVTADHVPPKSFFPEPRPSNLITVPACKKCNSGAGKDEDYFLATFMFSAAGVTDAGKTLWKQRLRRMFQKNTGLRGKIANGFSSATISTPAGLYVGQGMTLAFEEQRFDSVVRKIVRGLYYFEYDEALPAKIEVTTLFLSTKARYETAVAYADQLTWGKRQWPGIFEYRCARLPDTQQVSMWLMRYYSNTYFWAISRHDDGIK